ncbi:right-handed parallel beta-helix repeat-containing protein [Nonomuraea sp. NPDC050663]|uniref:right-handed parallel beta-helix repeat-containing protein n=1 Tax=Nonomuraea sp. NPDC050663 TaxID=3364370 RepID=UPI00378E1E45
MTASCGASTPPTAATSAPPAPATSAAAPEQSATPTPSQKPVKQPKYGVPKDLKLTPSTGVWAVPGQVIEGLDIKGHIFIDDGVTGVVIRNCRITGTGKDAFGIHQAGSGEVTVENVTIRGDFLDAGMGYENITARNLDIYGMTHDGAKVGDNFSITDSWIHDFKPSKGSHADGLQVFERVKNVLIKDNVIEIGMGGTWRGHEPTDDNTNAALFIVSTLDRGRSGKIVIDGNRLSGGGYTAYIGVKGADLSFVNNTFKRGAYLWDAVDERAYATVWRNNTFSDNDQEIPLPTR